MSSFLCFLCHSTVNIDTSDDIREKYRDVVGVHLCPDSQLCYICCQVVNKLCNFKTMCLKRSLEYPVLFSEKLFINLQKTDTDIQTFCTEHECKENHFDYNKKHTNYDFVHEEIHCMEDNVETYDNNSSSYVKLEVDEKRDSKIQPNITEQEKIYSDYNDYTNFNENQEYDPHFNYTNHIYDDGDSTNHSNDSKLDDTHVNDDEFNQEINENQFDADRIDDKEIYDNSELVQSVDFDEEVNKTNITNVDINESESNDVKAESNETPTKSTKLKKSKKKTFEKIVLSFKEQKTALELQRKEKKYKEAEFKCYRCALGFRFKDTYQSHMMRHEESNGQFSCSVCGLRFATQNARCMHTILHSEVYRCTSCDACVKRTHKARHTRDCWQNRAEAACHMCARTFRDANCLQQHLKRFHLAKSSKRTYSCNVCGKTYKEQSAVRNHMVKHINRRFACEKCPKTFASPYTLNQHQKSHLAPATEEEVHSCRVCETSYKTLKSLKAHLKNTSSHCNASLACSQCGRVFCTRAGLARHARGHARTHARDVTHAHTRQRHRAGTTRHLCHSCGRTYSTQSKLKRHLNEVCGRVRLEEEMTALYEEAANDIM